MFSLSSRETFDVTRLIRSPMFVIGTKLWRASCETSSVFFLSLAGFRFFFFHLRLLLRRNDGGYSSIILCQFGRLHCIGLPGTNGSALLSNKPFIWWRSKLITFFDGDGGEVELVSGPIFSGHKTNDISVSHPIISDHRRDIHRSGTRLHRARYMRRKICFPEWILSSNCNA